MSSRISPSSPWLLWAVTFAVFALYVFGAIVSFAGLYAIAPWLLLPETLYWSFPLAVDLAILVYKAAEVILRNDERKTHKIKKAVFGSVIFTFVSSAGNVVHVVNANDPDPLRFWGGVLFAGMIPWAVYLAASVLTDLIVDPLPRQEFSTEEVRGRLVMTQNFDATREEVTMEHEPPEEEPIRFLYDEDADGETAADLLHDAQWGATAADLLRDKRESEGRTLHIVPDLSVSREVKFEPFPENWGGKDGS